MITDIVKEEKCQVQGVSRAEILENVEIDIEENYYKFIDIRQNFSLDFNGRPQVFIHDYDTLLRTHPFYCFTGEHYGRVYRFETLNETDIDIHIFDKHDKDVLADFYSIKKHVMCGLPEFYTDSLKFTKTDVMYQELVKRMNGSMIKCEMGCLYCNGSVWLITERSNEYYANIDVNRVKYAENGMSCLNLQDILTAIGGKGMKKFIDDSYVGWVTKHNSKTLEWTSVGLVLSREGRIKIITTDW